MKKYNWGIIGCGGIAGKFAAGLQVLDQAILKGAASRSLEKAQAFCSKNEIEKPYGSYEELAADPEIDIVYIATPHSRHYEDTLLCLEHGKHVICEKSFTINTAQAQKLVDIATDKKLFLMEAMWTRFLPINIKLRELLAENIIGEIGIVKADLGFTADFNPALRLFNRELAGGALLDVGVYPISYADMIYNDEPQEIQGQAFIGTTGVDETSCYTINYGNGKFAVMNGSLRNNLLGQATISGSGGYIRVPFFHHPNEMFVKKNEDNEEMHISLPFTSTGYNYEAQEVMDCLSAGKLQSDVMPLCDTLRVMRTMDSLRGQWGLSYPQEQE